MPRRKKEPVIEQSNTPDEIVIENVQADVQRARTGLYTLDRAFGGGMPLRSFLELSGWEGSGKSSLAYFLASIVKKNGTIGVGDNEGCDPSYIAQAASLSGWRGRIRVVPYVTNKGDPMSEEEGLDTLADYLYGDDVSSIILDSIGGLMPVSEEEGSVSDGRVGGRARLIGPFLRRCIYRLRVTDTPKVLIATNHIHQVIGGQGTITSGGKAVHYLAATRFRLSADKDDDAGYWTIKGKVVKRRYHGHNPLNNFQAILVPGEGVHPGLTAVMDCVAMGIATLDRVIKLNDTSYGYFKQMIQNRGDVELFLPFHVALAERMVADVGTQEPDVLEARAAE